MIALHLLAAAALAAAAASTAGPGNKGFMSRHYPPTALARGEEGKVGFRIDLTGEGIIEQCAITQSSGFPTLDRETCDFIVQYARFDAARDSEGKRQATAKTGVITWKLPPGIKKSAAPTLASMAALPPPLICKRGKSTGSNRAFTTYCMTKDEWREQDQLARDTVERMQGRIFCGDHGCN